MNQTQFEDTLLQFIRREPFEPFVVEKLDGTVIHVEYCGVVYNAGGATYVTKDFDFIEFTCEDTRAMRAAVGETAS